MARAAAGMRPSAARTMTLCALLAALTAAGALFKIPFWPAPITLQSLFAMLGGLILGARRGALAQILYMLLGLAGLPIFAGGGGIGYVVTPRFGYVAGFILCAFLTGAAARRLRARTFPRLLLCCALGAVGLYAVGLPYMYIALRLSGVVITPWQTVVSGLILFLPGDALKCAACAALAPRIRRAMGMG